MWGSTHFNEKMYMTINMLLTLKTYLYYFYLPNHFMSRISDEPTTGSVPVHTNISRQRSDYLFFIRLGVLSVLLPGICFFVGVAIQSLFPTYRINYLGEFLTGLGFFVGCISFFSVLPFSLLLALILAPFWRRND